MAVRVHRVGGLLLMSMKETSSRNMTILGERNPSTTHCTERHRILMFRKGKFKIVGAVEIIPCQHFEPPLHRRVLRTELAPAICKSSSCMFLTILYISQSTVWDFISAVKHPSR